MSPIVQTVVRGVLVAAVLGVPALAAGGAAAWSVPPAPAAVGDCTSHAVAGLSANGSTRCVLRGGELILLLPTAAGAWSTPQVVGTALGRPMGVPTPYGMVGWRMPALSPGTATVTTSDYRISVVVV